MDFQEIVGYGYYFDRCIDLTFYDTDMNYICSLKTPEHGLKPTITIKGLLIEGGYAIDSYISIQNMAFDVDVAYVGYIKAKMYYSGLVEKSGGIGVNLRTKYGHTILYRVLYSDQEKEPPNRCVRFQCVVASKDMSMYNTSMYISEGSANFLKAGEDSSALIKVEKDKSGSKTTLKKICKELISIYNTQVSQAMTGNSKRDYNDLMRITVLEIEEPLEDLEVQVSSGEYKLGDIVRQLNSTATETAPNGMSYSRFKIVIDRGTMRVSTPVPNNWKDIAISKGYGDNIEKFYNDNYISVKTNTYEVFSGTLTKQKTNSVVPLNFVKSATRSECVIYVETLFDDRIVPGCHVAIKSNAIMGKKFGSSKSSKGGSRILQYLDKETPVIFRNTGKIEYLFSTTEDSYMKMQGPVDQSQEAQEWSARPEAIYE